MLYIIIDRDDYEIGVGTLAEIREWIAAGWLPADVTWQPIA